MERCWQWLKRLTLSLGQATPFLAVVGCLLALVAVVFQAMSQPLDFDESLHAHFLWLVSIGRVPHVDFWCQYPALGYVITLPYFRCLPESFLSLIPLRLFSVGLLVGVGAALWVHARRLGAGWIWGVLPLAAVVATPEVGSLAAEFRTDAYAAVLAVVALTVMFMEPTALRGGWAAGLSVFSLAIMPKYIYPLAFANLAYLGFGWVKLKSVRRVFVAAALGGVVMGLAAAQLLLLKAGVLLWRDVYWSAIFMHRYYGHCAATEKGLQSLLSYVAGYFAHNKWIAMFLVFGIVGWLAHESKQRGVRFWVGIAVIAGVIPFWGTCPWPYRQYLVPGLFCLLLFMPYAGWLLKRRFFQTAGILLLVGLSAQATLQCTRAALVNLAAGVLVADLRARQALLEIIPRSEKVVGLEHTHPCFREDQTFVTWDNEWGTPRGFTSLIAKDTATARCFQPEHLAKSFEQSPPASVAVRDLNYPPGWNQVIRDFMERHSAEYTGIPLARSAVFIRKNLLGTPDARRKLEAALVGNGRTAEAVGCCGLGKAMALHGRLEEAANYFAKAVRLDPGNSEAHYGWANVLALQGKLTEAVEKYNEAIKRQPDYAEAHFNWGNVLVRLGRLDEAQTHLEEAERLKPDYVEARCNLGNLLVIRGRLDEARVCYVEALRLNSNYAEGHYWLAGALARQKKMGEAVTHFRAALKIKPDYAAAANDLAWILATETNDAIRNVDEALRLAALACEWTTNRDAGYLDTLAAAYAEAGRFGDAVRAARAAIELAQAAGQVEAARQIQARLQLYQEGQRYRKGATPAP